MVRFTRLFAAAMLLIAFLSACGSAAPAAPTAAPSPTTAPAEPTAAPTPTTAAPAEPTAAPAPASKLPVVVTFSILSDFVQQVGGNFVEVTTLVGPGGDAHTFEPTPEDGKALVNAKVIVENGLEFETWLEDLYTASGSTATRIVASQGIETIAAEEHAGEEHAGEEHGHGEFDPHVWHDVNNAIAMVETIRAGLSAADPTNAAIYQANADRYTAELQALNTEIEQQIAALPAERRKLVTTHDTFGYFAKRYGFEVVGTALASISTESGDPSAAELADLITQIKTVGVPAIFAENVSNSNIMETVAREAGVELAPTLYTDALGESGSEGENYIAMMRYNVTTIVTALQ
jgi:ABC-type Zn uptake system ZnuABC Zn-binding protein ZnuA